MEHLDNEKFELAIEHQQLTDELFRIKNRLARIDARAEQIKLEYGQAETRLADSEAQYLQTVASNPTLVHILKTDVREQPSRRMDGGVFILPEYPYRLDKF
jgi:chromosome segregation ATPase